VVSLLGGLIPATHTVRKGNPVGHRPQLGDAGDGARWGAPVDIGDPGCRVEKTSRQYQNADGRVVTLTALVVTPAVPEVHVGDRLVVDGNERRVEKVDELVWLNGSVMHRECWTA
jgi:hypothetical protein